MYCSRSRERAKLSGKEQWIGVESLELISEEWKHYGELFLAGMW
jgi:hypothetical protein